MNHSCTLLYKFEVMGAYAEYESTFSLNLLSMLMLVECDHAIKHSVYCKNLYPNDIAILCFIATHIMVISIFFVSFSGNG